MSGYVDVHSHVIPSGDDGVADIDEGLALCRDAASNGTRVLYGTPHAQPPGKWHALTPERRGQAVAGYEAMKGECATFGLELRLGWEVAPTGILGTVGDYVLEGTGAVLLEFPGAWFSFTDPLAATRRQIGQIHAAGFGVVLAHPERCPEIQRKPDLVLPFVADGTLVCFNADSFLGAHDSASERCAWQLLALGAGDLIASDAHRLARPSRLHEAVEAVTARYGAERALPLADGSALSRL